MANLKKYPTKAGAGDPTRYRWPILILKYVQVIKKRVKGRMVDVSTRMVALEELLMMKPIMFNINYPFTRQIPACIKSGRN